MKLYIILFEYDYPFIWNKHNRTIVTFVSLFHYPNIHEKYCILIIRLNCYSSSRSCFLIAGTFRLRSVHMFKLIFFHKEEDSAKTAVLNGYVPIEESSKCNFFVIIWCTKDPTKINARFQKYLTCLRYPKRVSQVLMWYDHYSLRLRSQIFMSKKSHSVH